MKTYKVLFVIALIILIVPFLGVPEIYKNWANIIVALFLFSYSLRERLFVKSQNRNSDVFIESHTSEDEVGINEEVIEQGEEFEDKLMEEK
jgi:hypothetical protein